MNRPSSCWLRAQGADITERVTSSVKSWAATACSCAPCAMPSPPKCRSCSSFPRHWSARRRAWSRRGDMVVVDARSQTRVGHGRLDRRRRLHPRQRQRLAGAAGRHAAGAARQPARGGRGARPAADRVRAAPRPPRHPVGFARRAVLRAGDAQGRRRRAPAAGALSRPRRSSWTIPACCSTSTPSTTWRWRSAASTARPPLRAPKLRSRARAAKAQTALAGARVAACRCLVLNPTSVLPARRAGLTM